MVAEHVTYICANNVTLSGITHSIVQKVHLIKGIISNNIMLFIYNVNVNWFTIVILATQDKILLIKQAY